MSKDNIPTFQSEELSLNNAEIPTLDTQTANQLLNNVFNACDMDPSSIPVEVLESWGNYQEAFLQSGTIFSVRIYNSSGAFTTDVYTSNHYCRTQERQICHQCSLRY